jgi:mannose-1-phosphate guanylyltransferase
MSRIIPKPWGHEQILLETDAYIVKHLFIKAGHRISEQFHKKKIETMMLVDGVVFIDLGAKRFHPQPLVPIFIPNKVIHRVTGVTDALILEVSSPHPDDVVRLSDDYSRSPGE